MKCEICGHVYSHLLVPRRQGYEMDAPKTTIAVVRLDGTRSGVGPYRACMWCADRLAAIVRERTPPRGRPTTGGGA